MIAMKVACTMSSYAVYTEQQQFNQRWLFMLVKALLAITGLTAILLIRNNSVNVFLAMLPPILVTAVYYVLISSRLKVRINAVGIYYQFKPFHLRQHVILRRDISSVKVIGYEPVSDYGGYYGLLITMKNNRHILIGTHRPDELAAYLKNNWTTVAL